MTEVPAQSYSGNTLTLTDAGEAARVSSIEAVRRLDPELLEYANTRRLIEMGAQLIGEVTDTYGTPTRPRWNEGTVESKLMAYHNGGEDGHTSAGELGVGVPRAALVVAQAVNRTAGREVYDPLARAIAFYAASAHDLTQNCGRTLLPEGWGEAHGDERLSAETARDRYLEAGGDPAVARLIYGEIMATAFDPNTKTQNINYAAWEAGPVSPDALRAVLGQELVAAADLLNLAHIRGAVAAVEIIVENLASNASGRILQAALQAHEVDMSGETDMARLLDVISADETLCARFTELMDGQDSFVTGFRFSDRAIREACGQGLDELFPWRTANAAYQARLSESLRSRTATPLGVWQQSRAHAGYRD